MKTHFFLGALFAVAVAASAQPTVTAPKLINDVPFPLVSPARAPVEVVQTQVPFSFENVPLP